MDEELRRLERLASQGDPEARRQFEAAEARVLSEKAKHERMLAEQRKRELDEHPALFRRNAVEGKSWKRGWNGRKTSRTEKRYLKRKAHKADRRDAKEALRGGNPRTKKKPGDSWEVW